MIKITSMFDAFRCIGCSGDFSKGEMKLLFYLMGVCGVKNKCTTSLRDICNETGELKGNVRNYLEGLVGRNIVKLKKGDRKGNRPTVLEVSIEYSDFKPCHEDPASVDTPIPIIDENLLNKTIKKMDENLENGSLKFFLKSFSK